MLGGREMAQKLTKVGNFFLVMIGECHGSGETPVTRPAVHFTRTEHDNIITKR